MSDRPTNPPQAVHGQTSAAHRVWRVGADIDTDALAPGAYMKFGIDEIARHCLEIARPDFAASVQPGDVIVAGPNFGIGSSREQAAAALVRLGVRGRDRAGIQRPLFSQRVQRRPAAADLR